MPEMTEALIRELEMEADYLNGAPIETIYFGGGTPSLLGIEALERIFNQIDKHYRVAEGAEVTLEANPDDLTQEKIKALRNTPINRLSIGIQSFSDEALTWMNRSHHSAQAVQSVEWALQAGFHALSLDLIYGVPVNTDAIWQADVQRILEMRPEHISCYGLTVEEKTALHHQVIKGKSPAPDEEQTVRQFEYLMDIADRNGYHHYEISNFALPGKEARHNSAYWFGAPYLGLGPSAHSYRKGERRWNVANNAHYMKGIMENEPMRESELLTTEQEYNEYVMTRLRTSYGANRNEVAAFGHTYLAAFDRAVEQSLRDGLLEHFEGNRYRLTKHGKSLADGVIINFFC